MSLFRLETDRAAMLVVDVQERLCAAMPKPELERLVNRTRALLVGAQALRLPVMVTEQYPRGLGRTLEALSALLPPATQVVEKLRFSAAIEPVLSALAGRDQLLIAGMESHVCIFQTVRDLAEHGQYPWICADAVLSRTATDRELGLDLCRAVGAKVTTVESALFDLLGQAGSPEFKVISAAVK